MQTSPYHLLPKVLDIISLLKPKTVLDIGCGDGFYGLAIKRFIPHPMMIDGIDIAPTAKPWTKDIYRSFVQKDINQYTSTLEDYDLLLALEILESIGKRDGKKLLKTLLLNQRHILVSVRRGVWDKSDFAELGNVLFLFDAERLLVFITKDPQMIKTLRKYRITSTIIRGAKSSGTVSRLLHRVTNKRDKK